MDWKPLLASITESVDEELRLRNAYLAAENRILRNRLKRRRVQLIDAEREGLTSCMPPRVAPHGFIRRYQMWPRVVYLQPADKWQRLVYRPLQWQKCAVQKVTMSSRGPQTPCLFP